jgi:glyoxylase-like metal-dependent hydrolase (beta-lactamase superfamily II)
MTRTRILFSIVISVLLSESTLAQSSQSYRGIQHIKGNVYQIQDDNNTFSAFFVTPDGIILTDPMDARTAKWLKAELEQQFNVPVRYVIYSNAIEHNGGAETYEGAIVIAHENTPAALIRDENPAVIPDLTFSDRMTITLGDKRVELIYPGKGRDNNTIVVHYPAERVVLAVDSLWINRVAYRSIGGPNYFPEWIDALRNIEKIDFDILLAAHGVPGTGAGATGTKADLTEFRKYYEALYDAVMTAKEQGMSIDEARDSIELPQFSHLGMYDEWFKMNVEGVYKLSASSRE